MVPFVAAVMAFYTSTCAVEVTVTEFVPGKGQTKRGSRGGRHGSTGSTGSTVTVFSSTIVLGIVLAAMKRRRTRAMIPIWEVGQNNACVDRCTIIVFMFLCTIGSCEKHVFFIQGLSVRLKVCHCTVSSSIVWLEKVFLYRTGEASER